MGQLKYKGWICVLMDSGIGQEILDKSHTNPYSLHSEQFLVGAIIAKLPPSWRDYRKKMLHRNEEISLEEIRQHLRIEQESRSRDFNDEKSNGVTSKANAVANPPNKGKGNGHEIQMDNKKMSKIKGKGTIDWFFTSGMKVLLTNHLYVLEMSKNRVSGNFLGKQGIKVVIDSGKLILSKENVLLERVMLVMILAQLKGLSNED
ncbi:uncharacterized protein LOC133779203 [Humulus lupulus]|uniref:uncharacterized protein LOC133779203 n=1 Tax=Humulus lupulus TaxID=3486 RepID=UPI002B4117B4|nr:uncharacterized protein LOC133779203 [Humulus lupulus]